MFPSGGAIFYLLIVSEFFDSLTVFSVTHSTFWIGLELDLYFNTMLPPRGMPFNALGYYQSQGLLWYMTGTLLPSRVMIVTHWANLVVISYSKCEPWLTLFTQ